MKRFVVKISTAITVDAEDENEAPEIAVQLCDFGSFDYEVHTEEEWEEVELTDTYEEVSSNGKTTGSKPVDVGSIPTTSANPQQHILYYDLKNAVADIKDDFYEGNDSHSHAEYRGVCEGLDMLVRHFEEIKGDDNG